MDDRWTVYVTTPSQHMVEWDDWEGSLADLLKNFTQKHGWVYQSHNVIYLEVFFKVEN